MSPHLPLLLMMLFVSTPCDCTCLVEQGCRKMGDKRCNLKCRCMITAQNAGEWCWKPFGDGEAVDHILGRCIYLCVLKKNYLTSIYLSVCLIKQIVCWQHLAVKITNIDIGSILKQYSVWHSFRGFNLEIRLHVKISWIKWTVSLHCPLLSPKAPLQCCPICLSFESLHFHI